MIDLSKLKLIGDDCNLTYEEVWDKIVSFYQRIEDKKKELGIYWTASMDIDHLADIATALDLYQEDDLSMDKVELFTDTYYVEFSSADYEEPEKRLNMGTLFLPIDIFNGREDKLFDKMILTYLKDSIEAADMNCMYLQHQISEVSNLIKELEEERNNITRFNDLITKYEEIVKEEK